MRSLLSFMVMANLFISCTGKQEKQEIVDCSRFKKGEFFIKAENGLPPFLLRRTDSFQYVTDEQTGAVATYKLSWKADCEYELLFKNEDSKPTPGPEPPYKRILDSLRKKPINVRITNAGANFYIFEVRRLGVAMIVGDTAWVYK